MDETRSANHYTVYSGLRGGCCLSDAQIKAGIKQGVIECVKKGTMQCYRYNTSEMEKFYWDTVDLANQ